MSSYEKGKGKNAGRIALANPCKVLREITEEDRNFYHKNLRFDES
jgi:galactoside O-acetyltransferase